MLGWVRGLSTAKDVLWMSGIVVGMTVKDKISRCQPQHRELNQSTLTCSRAQHMRLSRKEGKGGTPQVGLGKHARLLHSAKKSSLQSLIKVGPSPSATLLSGHKHHKESTLLHLDAPAPQTSSSLVQTYKQVEEGAGPPRFLIHTGQGHE